MNRSAQASYSDRSSGSPSGSSVAISRLTAWYQGEKLRRGVGSMVMGQASSSLGRLGDMRSASDGNDSGAPAGRIPTLPQ